MKSIQFHRWLIYMSMPGQGSLITLQTAQALENVKAILETKGLTLDDIIKTTVFIKDMNDFGKINEVYAKYICGEILPARSCVEVARLPKDGLVEIEVIALKK